jgi:hypothetical protein
MVAEGISAAGAEGEHGVGGGVANGGGRDSWLVLATSSNAF